MWNHARYGCLSFSVLSLTTANFLTQHGCLLLSLQVFLCNSASLAWHVHKHKDGVSHQCPPTATIQRRVSGVWSLRAHFKALRPLGGWREPAGHHSPEERALSLADRSTLTAPHGGRKRFPFTSFFFFFCDRPRRARQGWVRCRAVALGVRRRGKWLKEVWRR